MVSSRNDINHLPVMSEQVVEFLITHSDGAYLDLTAGLGGHLKALAKSLGDSARLYGVDIDHQAIKKARENLGGLKQQIELTAASYTNLEEVVVRFDDKKFNGILLDLGLSSYQLDNPERGFSFRFDSPLDMRFEPQLKGKTAADIVNTYSERELAGIIRLFGEEKNAARLAKTIVTERQKQMIITTAQLINVIKKNIRPHLQVKTSARVFQALRIAVNNELDAITAVLPESVKYLKDGGRMVVISYHSLEDRLVKRYFQKEAKGCVCPPKLPICVCGKKPSLKIITSRVVKPSKAEIEKNPRSRSAKLRVVEKLSV